MAGGLGRSADPFTGPNLARILGRAAKVIREVIRERAWLSPALLNASLLGSTLWSWSSIVKALHCVDGSLYDQQT